MPIEQAIFTSTQTDHGDGYQLAGRSAGVGEAQARELLSWGPSHDSLLNCGQGAASYNYFPLPGGVACISKSMAGGAEYSCRGGLLVTTHFLLVPPDVLARFSNNPFAILKAVAADGLFCDSGVVIGTLPPLRLPGRASALDRTILERLSAHDGVDPSGLDALVMAVDAALSHERLALIGGPPAELLMAGLFSCLPPQLRLGLSFSTGLKYSGRRPFRLLTAPADRGEQRRIARHYTLVDLQGEPPTDDSLQHGWARFVRAALDSGRTAALAGQFTQTRPDMSVDEWDALGQRLIDQLLNGNGENDNQFISQPADNDENTAGDRSPNRAHAAHTRFEKDRAAPVVAGKRRGKALDVTIHDPAMLEQLEVLDDTVFDAIEGKPEAMARLHTLWPEMLDRLDDDQLNESREQYLRRALAAWNESDGAARDPKRAAAALDVLCLLMGK